MKTRLHLVRFMYINLILSCCFWLYDNAAAADAFATNGAAVENSNAAFNQADAEVKITKEFLAHSYDGVAVEQQNHFINAKSVAAEEAPSATTKSTEADDKNVVNAVDAPRTSEKDLMAAVTDTSVNANMPPSSVNNKNDNSNEYISVVPNSEDNLSAEEAKGLAKIPKNQFNNHDVNNNIYKNVNADVEQTEQIQHTNTLPESVNSALNRRKLPEPTENLQLDPKSEHEHELKESLPEIFTELPTVPVAELPTEPKQLKDRLDAVVNLDEAQHVLVNDSERQQRAKPFEAVNKMAQGADVMQPNDLSAGLDALESFASTAAGNATISNEGSSAEEAAAQAGSNETAEEVPMPVFSEWAQKQIEAEASREQAMELEQQVANNSAQRRNATGASGGKSPSLKLRAKNYASPDCGAKIIASNADATNTGAVLSHSSDEYMLSTCGSRIWFVVELCEAVQAQKVELANFELFSSSPKNFTVAVSKRFPTRDWSNVGRFAAEDKRTVQTFELHPHLFGKFVRVDIHSHYSKEHFCPISLFRVFGTSEFEAFETEIRHSDELDDFDDDFGGQEQPHKSPHAGHAGGANIFQSASDVVIQMVKKAAQVLVKPTKALRWSSDSLQCYTPVAGIYSCESCNSSMVERINHLLSCQSQQLQLILPLPQLRQHFLQTRICQEEFNISLGLSNSLEQLPTSGMEKRQSFYISMLPVEHVGALCKLLQAEYKAAEEHAVETPRMERPQEAVATTEQMPISESPRGLVNESRTQSEPLPADTPILEVVPLEVAADLQQAESRQEAPPIENPTITDPPSDVNIFNVPSEAAVDGIASSTATAAPGTTTATTTSSTVPAGAASDTPAASSEGNGMETSSKHATGTTNSVQVPSLVESENAEMLGSGNGNGNVNSLDESNLANWESIDSLLTTTVASITAGGGAAAAAAAAVANGNANMAGGSNNVATAAAGGGVNLQPKLTHGPQSESVFIRLSNRIKALERNMSLSGQYLEELSRRYKRQVEELQQTLMQQTLTVRTLEDQSRRYMEQEQLLQQQSSELAGEVRALTYQVQACILVIILVGTCIFLMLVVGTVYYRKLRLKTEAQLQPTGSVSSSAKQQQQQLSRRKSYEQMTQQGSDKQRRPSEEAMLILNSSNSATDAPKVVKGTATAAAAADRQRKLSVCYGSNNNIVNHMFGARRKVVKTALHNSLDSAQAGGLDRYFDMDSLKSNRTQPAMAGKKKSIQHMQQELKRQESAPACCTQGDLVEESTTQSDFDESLILDDEDLANFIPNSDLAYNEFMPGGPSGYQIVDAVDKKSDKVLSVKKSRRVSSPAFFKSPFSKMKNKGGSFNGIAGIRGNHTAHEATSWEWYRLRRNEKQSKHHSTVPSVSNLDSSSLSEVSFPLNSTQNSFRILGEAISSSGEGRINGKGNPAQIAAISGTSSTSSSSSSSSSKKKPRTFNNFLRKVF